MKKIISVIALICMIAAVPMFAQDIRASKIPAPVGASTGATATTGSSVNLLVLTSELPVSFVRMAHTDGDWKLGGTMTVGASYVVMFGQGKLQADGSVTNYNSLVYLGPVVSMGANTNESENATAGVTVGAVLGLGPMSMIYGYDIMNEQPVLGIGFKIDVLTITDATTVVLQRWDPKKN